MDLFALIQSSIILEKLRLFKRTCFKLYPSASVVKSRCTFTLAVAALTAVEGPAAPGLPWVGALSAR